MRKIAVTFGIVCIALIGYGAYFITAQLPALAQKQATQTLQDMGFQGISLSEPDIRISAARFENIQLDEYGISTIDLMEIHYSPLSLLVMRQPSVVKLHGLTLVGELTPDMSVSIAGWNAADAHLNLQGGNLRTLEIEKGRLSLLTDNIGGINIDFDVQTRSKSNQVDLQGQIRSQQKHISMIASAKGFINRDGVWQAELEISQGKFNLGPIKATRVNGTLKIFDQPSTPVSIVSQIQAGGASIYGYPWQNASASFDGTLDEYTIAADMKSIGYQGLELGITANKQQGALNISGVIHSERDGLLPQYLSQRKDVETGKLEVFEKAGDYSFTIEPPQLTLLSGQDQIALEL